MTDDQLLLDDFKKKEQKKKKDEKTVERVEVLEDKVSTYITKEEEELKKLESTRAYYRRCRLSAEQKLDIEVAALEARIEKAKKVAADSINYANQMLEKVDIREDILKSSIAKRVKRTQIKKESLVNSIHTPSIKKQVEQFGKDSSSDSDSPVIQKPKIQPKVVMKPKPIEPKKYDDVEIAEFSRREEAKSKESKLADLRMKIRIGNNQLVVLENQLKALNLKEPQDVDAIQRKEDEIRDKEIEINSWKEEHRFVEASIPQDFRY